MTSTVQTYTTAETTWEYDTVWSTELDTSTYYSTEVGFGFLIEVTGSVFCSQLKFLYNLSPCFALWSGAYISANH